MKKKIAIILTIVLMMTCVPISSSAYSNITVTYNGQPIYFDVQPQMVNNRVMVPMRAIFERFGMNVSWMPETREIFAIGASRAIGMTIGSYRMLKNGTSLYIDVPPMILNNRTLVPLRAVAESLDIDVQWNGNSRTVTMKDEFADVNEKPYDVLKKLIKSRGTFQESSATLDERYELSMNKEDSRWTTMGDLIYYPETDKIQIFQYTFDDSTQMSFSMYFTNESSPNTTFAFSSGKKGASPNECDRIDGVIDKEKFNAQGINGLSSLHYSLKTTSGSKQLMNELASPTISLALIDVNNVLIHFNTGISIRDLGFTAFADKHGIY